MPTVNIKSYKLISYPGFCPVCEREGDLKRLLVGTVERTKRDKLEDRQLRMPIHSYCRSSRELKSAAGTVIVVVLTVVLFHYFLGPYDASNDIFLYIIGLPVYFVIRKVNPLPFEVKFYEDYVSFEFRSEKYAQEFKKLNINSIHAV